MTKQKNEIANGFRLENASWQMWKQRNKLKTVSLETLNWYVVYVRRCILFKLFFLSAFLVFGLCVVWSLN